MFSFLLYVLVYQLFTVEASFKVSSLDGHNGFSVDGVAQNDFSGYSVSSAGDFNGDGIDDIIIGAPYAKSHSGESYLIFGSAKGPSSTSDVFDLSTLVGKHGFTISGSTTDQSGASISSAGDFNGDGYDDIIIGAPGYNSFTGQSYIVFGGSTVGSSGIFELTSIDGTNGLRLYGVDVGDYSGTSVSSVGDFNGDGYDDILIGAYEASQNDILKSGESYLLFGGSDIGLNSNDGSISLSTLNGQNGFVMYGIASNDHSGYSVSGAGDINGDGYNDVIIGASNGGSTSSDKTTAGESYIIFGNNQTNQYNGTFELSSLLTTSKMSHDVSQQTSSTSTLYSTATSAGFIIAGALTTDQSGFSVSSAGDFNGDGYDDMIIGAPYSDCNGDHSGQAYLIYGNSNIDQLSLIDLNNLNGLNGFQINGVTPDAYTGWSVSNAGDIDNDGYDDVIIGAPYAGTRQGGISYLIYGGSNIAYSSTSTSTSNGILELVDLENKNINNNNKRYGIVIKGNELSLSGTSVSNAGDINNDGYHDIIIGAYKMNANDITESGSSYVFFNFNIKKTKSDHVDKITLYIVIIVTLLISFVLLFWCYYKTIRGNNEQQHIGLYTKKPEIDEDEIGEDERDVNSEIKFTTAFSTDVPSQMPQHLQDSLLEYEHNHPYEADQNNKSSCEQMVHNILLDGSMSSVDTHDNFPPEKRMTTDYDEENEIKFQLIHEN